MTSLLILSVGLFVRPFVCLVFFFFMFLTRKYAYFEGNLERIMIQKCQCIGLEFRSQMKKISPVDGDLLPFAST